MENLIPFFNSNFFIAITTFIVGSIAYVVYMRQKSDSKRGAAKIILQEIRRAEDLIAEYKEYRQYKFTKRIIATNSWAKNLHYFVGDLDQDEIDKISTLYSTGEYLDSIIRKISDIQFGLKMQSSFQGAATIAKNQLITQQTNPPNQQLSGGQVQFGQQPIAPSAVEVTIPAPWKELLDEITDGYAPIYHSTVANKLKRIAKMK